MCSPERTHPRFCGLELRADPQTCTLAENETNAALVRALDLLNLLGHDSVEGYKAHHTQGPSVVDISSLNAQDSGTNMDKVCEILDAIDKHNPDLKCLVTHIQTSVIQYAQLLFEQIDKGKADDIQAMLGSVGTCKDRDFNKADIDKKKNNGGSKVNAGKKKYPCPESQTSVVLRKVEPQISLQEIQ
uniref:Uncharacterized protein n=1 Tax=Ditylenchus dipsaci TaxID=166011 RepID=A0A915D035_9BILA